MDQGQLTLRNLLIYVDAAYPSDEPVVIDAFERKDFDGDTLALFIAQEIEDTFIETDTKLEKITAARRAMRCARQQLQSVEDMLDGMMTRECERLERERKSEKRRKEKHGNKKTDQKARS